MKDDLVYVEHILECIRRIERYTAAGKDTFFSNTLIQDAVIRNLQVLAESSKRVSLPRQKEFGEIPWRQIAGFRNVAVHEYLHVELQYLWEIVSLDLPDLKFRLVALRAKLLGNS